MTDYRIAEDIHPMKVLKILTPLRYKLYMVEGETSYTSSIGELQVKVYTKSLWIDSFIVFNDHMCIHAIMQVASGADIEVITFDDNQIFQRMVLIKDVKYKLLSERGAEDFIKFRMML